MASGASPASTSPPRSAWPAALPSCSTRFAPTSRDERLSLLPPREQARLSDQGRRAPARLLALAVFAFFLSAPAFFAAFGGSHPARAYAPAPPPNAGQKAGAGKKKAETAKAKSH